MQFCRFFVLATLIPVLAAAAVESAAAQPAAGVLPAADAYLRAEMRNRGIPGLEDRKHSYVRS
jgi:hypothetical protein